MDGLRILIVDDHAGLRASMRESLLKQGEITRVDEACNGQQALQLIAKRSYNVVITDIVMPVLDGYGLMEEMQKLPLASMPKVIVATALARDDFVMRAIELGASFYLVKPFEPQRLTAHVLEVAKVRSAAAPAFSPELPPPRQQSIEEWVGSLFLTIGIPAHIKGYQYLRAGVKLAVEQPNMIGGITKLLYPSIAAQFDTTSSKVERAIRHAIEVAWDRGRIDSLNQAFGCRVCTPDEKPSNGQFIAMLADKITTEMGTRGA